MIENFKIAEINQYCQNCEYIVNKQKHQIEKKVLRQDHNFSTRLPYANKRIRENWMNMVNTTYKSTENMINKLQEMKGKTKLKFYKNLNNYFDIMNIRMDNDPFAKNAQSISTIYHELLLLMKFLQTKPQVKNMNITFYDLYYTVIKNKDDKEVVNDEYENDFITLNDLIIPNHYVGTKGREI